MIHYIYKVTNTINGKYYIGRHSTLDLQDGYMGSGKLIKMAIKKYGVDSFVKEILEFHEDFYQLNEAEKNAITEKMIKDSNCYNVMNGGTGFDSETSKKMLKNDSVIKKRDIWFKNNKEFLSEIQKERWENEKYREKMSKHKEKSAKILAENVRNFKADKEKYSASLERRRLSLRNRSVIYKNGIEKYKRVKNDELESYLNDGWVLGKKEKIVKEKPPKIIRKYTHNEKNKTCLFVDVNELENYLKDGWNLGKKFMNTGTNGTKWMNNGEISKAVKIEYLSDYLEDGWVLGNLHTKDINRKKGEEISKSKFIQYCNKHDINYVDVPKVKTELIFFNETKDDYKKLIYRNANQLNKLHQSGYLWIGDVKI